MNIEKVLIARFVAFALLLLSGASSYGQVDPEWLRSWNEASEHRPSKLTSSERIAGKKEPGAPLTIRGKVFKPDGSPASNVVVHGYHRNSDGFEFGPLDRALSTWELQGWAKTNDSGHFTFRTIRPAPDYMGREGAHLHFTLVSSELGRQWSPKFFFSDDSLVTNAQRDQSGRAGKFGSVVEARTTDGVAYINVNIKLKESADF